MNYRLTNFRIQAAKGARIKDQESSNYLSCTAFNPMNRFEKSHNIAIFDKGMVEYYKTKLPLERGGVLPNEGWSESGMDPYDKIFINGCTVEYDLGGLYCRKYTSAIVDGDGNVIPGKDEGDIVKDANGNPIVFTKISVFCQYCFKTEAVFDDFGMPVIDQATGNTKVKIMRDEHGKAIEQWVAGWSPTEVGESMRRLLTPYTAISNNVSQAPEVEEGPNIFGAAETPAQQAATGESAV